MKTMIAALTVILAACSSYAAYYHVATTGDDGNPGTKADPSKTISKAAEIAQPGDTITVHEGVYRERINPLLGGQSDKTRIIY